MIIKNKKGGKSEVIKKVKKGPQYRLAADVVMPNARNAQVVPCKRTSVGYRKT